MRLNIILVVALIICEALFSPFETKAKERAEDFTVVIDAGHGGKDAGATDNGAKEKDITLGVALQLESIIKKKMKSAQVVMTRKNDSYLTLQERADKANKAKGDLFISIHTNSVDKSNKNRKTVSGSSVYALGLHKDDNNMRVAQRENSVIELESNFEQKYSGFDPSKDESYIIFEMAQKKNLSKSIKFAEDVQNELVGIGRGNRGVHQAGFWVLWATSMPSVLIELDFICNPGAAKYMTSEKGQKELASAIFKAIEKYEKIWQKSKKSSGGKRLSSSEANEDLESFDDATLEASASSASVVVTKSSPSSSKKKMAAPSSGKKSSRGDYAAARRRRRSENGRAVSDKKNYETSMIPLHKDGERAGVIVADSDERNTVSISSSDSDNLTSDKDKKSKKKKDKKDKKSKKEKQKKRKRSDKAHNAKTDKFVKVYKIQILASADLLKQSNPRFCGLSPITVYKENNLYKYYYGESADKAEIEEMLKDVKRKIPDAFIVTSTKSLGSAKN